MPRWDFIEGGGHCPDWRAANPAAPGMSSETLPSSIAFRTIGYQSIDGPRSQRRWSSLAHVSSSSAFTSASWKQSVRVFRSAGSTADASPGFGASEIWMRETRTLSNRLASKGVARQHSRPPRTSARGARIRTGSRSGSGDWRRSPSRRPRCPSWTTPLERLSAGDAHPVRSVAPIGASARAAREIPTVSSIANPSSTVLSMSRGPGPVGFRIHVRSERIVRAGLVRGLTIDDSRPAFRACDLAREVGAA